MPRWLAGAGLALVAVGVVIAVGIQPRAPHPEPRVTAPVVDHAAEARRAIAAREWAFAADHLRAALRDQPHSVFLHYNLALAASWLDASDEAAREFAWVVAHAPSDSEEATVARTWLGQGRDAGPKIAPDPVGPREGSGAIHGVATWSADGGEPKPAARVQLFLIGLRDTATGREYRVLRSDREGRFEFRDVVPGSYRLTDAIAGQPKWRLKVTVQPGHDLALALTSENSTQKRDDFPEGG